MKQWCEERLPKLLRILGLRPRKFITLDHDLTSYLVAFYSEKKLHASAYCKAFKNNISIMHSKYNLYFFWSPLGHFDSTLKNLTLEKYISGKTYPIKKLDLYPTRVKFSIIHTSLLHNGIISVLTFQRHALQISPDTGFVLKKDFLLVYMFFGCIK